MPKKIEKQATFKPTATLKFFIAIGVLQLLVITGAVITSLWLSTQSGDTVVGGSVVFGVLFSLLFIIAALLSPITLIGVPIYLVRKKPTRKWFALSIATLVVSFLFLLQGVYTVFSIVKYNNFEPQETTDTVDIQL